LSDQPRRKLCQWMKSVDSSKFDLDVDDDFPLLPHLVQRLHVLLSSSAKSYVDSLLLHCLVRDCVKLSDDSLSVFMTEVSNPPSTKGSDTKTINRAVRRIIATANRAEITRADLKQLAWKTREGLKHEWPTLCDYCDYLGVLAERLKLPYSSVYSAFGGSHGHFNVYQGRAPIYGKLAVSSSSRHDMKDLGVTWHDIKGGVKPEGAPTTPQLKRVVEYAKVNEALKNLPPSRSVESTLDKPPETESASSTFEFRPVSPPPQQPCSSPIYDATPGPSSPPPAVGALMVSPQVVPIINSPPRGDSLITKFKKAKRKLGRHDSFALEEHEEPSASLATSPRLTASASQVQQRIASMSCVLPCIVEVIPDF